MVAKIYTVSFCLTTRLNGHSCNPMSSAINQLVHSEFVGGGPAITRYTPGELTSFTTAARVTSGRTQGGPSGSWDVMRSRVPGVDHREIPPVGPPRFPTSRTPRGRHGSTSSSATSSSASSTYHVPTVSIRSPPPQPPPDTRSRKAQKGPGWGRMAADPFGVAITSDAAKEVKILLGSSLLLLLLSLSPPTYLSTHPPPVCTCMW